MSWALLSKGSDKAARVCPKSMTLATRLPQDTVAVARAPGRLDVMGGIADYSGSLVLQLPLAEACHVAVQRHSLPQQRVWRHMQVRHVSFQVLSCALSILLIRCCMEVHQLGGFPGSSAHALWNGLFKRQMHHDHLNIHEHAEQCVVTHHT